MSFNLNKKWMRQNQVDISKYLPAFLQKDVNFKAVTDVTSMEHEKIRIGLQDIFDQFYVETATWGLNMYERVLNLSPSADETIEYRRKQILIRLCGTDTSTIKFLTQIVNTYGSGYIEEYNSRYSFNIYASVPEAAALAKMKEDIQVYKPAHLGFTIYLGHSWNGNIRFNGSKTYGTYTINGDD